MKNALLVCADDGKAPHFSWQVSHALQSLGWGVNTFNYRSMQLHRLALGRSHISKSLLKTANALKPDLVFVIKGESLLPGTIDALRKQGAKTANWTLDEPFGEFSMHNKVQTIPEYDSFFIFDSHYCKLLEEAGAKNAVFLPCSSEPILYHEQLPWEKRQYLCDAGFVGSHQQNRQAVLERVADLDVKVWGYRWPSISHDSPLWPKIEREIPKGDKTMKGLNRMCLLWNSIRCNINVHHMQARHDGANLRVFDLMATKSFQLCDMIPGLDEVVKTGQDVIAYRSPAELRKMISYFSESEDERKRIVDKAYDALVARHRTLHRMKLALCELGLQARERPTRNNCRTSLRSTTRKTKRATA